MACMSLPALIRQTGIPEFAKRFQISERAALSYLRGTRKPRVPLAQRIAAAFGVKLEDIFVTPEDK